MSEQDEVQRRIASIEGLVREAERVSDPASRSLCRQLVQSLMDLHGAGLGRMLEIVHQTGEPGQQIIDEMGSDPLVRSLLLLYGLHPLDMETRVLQALEKVRPYLRSHGSEVELIGLTDAGVLTLRFEGSSHSCPSSAATLQSTVEQAVYDAVPDVASIVVDVAEESSPGAFVPLEALRGGARGSEA
jgi:Fe-S cluster biogenesis protein NfuA